MRLTGGAYLRGAPGGPDHGLSRRSAVFRRRGWQMGVPLVGVPGLARQACRRRAWPRRAGLVVTAAARIGSARVLVGDWKEQTHVPLAGLHGLTRPAHAGALHPGPLADRPEPAFQPRGRDD